MAQRVHGKSKYIQCENPASLADCEFQDFAPAPCVCCGCCAPQTAKDRKYARVYENRFEANFPIAPFGPCTCDEKCIIDQVVTVYHDRVPSRAGMCCYIIPCICCGPPVIYVQKPMCCCCIDVSHWFGETIMYAPCNCFGLKKYLCCGGPCYAYCGSGMFGGVKDGINFLSVWSMALNKYFAKNNIDKAEKAIFEAVKDSEIDAHGAQNVAPAVEGQVVGAQA
jgi:hypothetical protein